MPGTRPKAPRSRPVERPAALLAGGRAIWLGTTPFTDAHARNLTDASDTAADGRPRLCFFEPAAAVLTLGRRVRQAPALSPTIARARALGIPTIEADRGGQATLHLPGQLVVFIAVSCDRTALGGLVDLLLDAAAAVARDAGVAHARGHGLDTGLWVGTAKLASVGLRHTAGVARHGLALNVKVDRTLTPELRLCGHQGAGYADLSGAQDAVDLRETAALFAQALGLALADASPAEPPRDGP